MTIRSENGLIDYNDIMRLRGVTASRAKQIFWEIGKVNSLPPYEPRTIHHYQKWVDLQITKRLKKSQKKL